MLFRSSTLTSIAAVYGDRHIKVTNQCAFPVWVQIPFNANTVPVKFQTDDQLFKKLETNDVAMYDGITDGWSSGTFYLHRGENACTVGASGNHNCDYHHTNQVEWTMESSGVTYDISNVEGYGFGLQLNPVNIPSGGAGVLCQVKKCDIPIDDCPNGPNCGCPVDNWDDEFKVCYSGCAECESNNNWQPNGKCADLCCPTGSSADCLAKGIQQASLYSKTLKCYCPDVYAFSYDDVQSTYSCQSVEVSLDAIICPDSPVVSQYNYHVVPSVRPSPAGTGSCVADSTGVFGDRKSCIDFCVQEAKPFDYNEPEQLI